jgi:hypothetical protein
MKKKIISFILIFFILTITLGCGTENTNTKANSTNNTKEDIQEEIIPDKVYQDEEAKILITKAEEEIKRARKNYDFIKKDQDLLLKKLAPLESKIDIPTAGEDYTIRLLNSMLPYIETMANNTDALSVSLEYYENSFKLVNDAENLDISPEYRAYLTKYKEALVKEKNGVFYYQRATYNKTRLLLADVYTGIYNVYYYYFIYYNNLSREFPGDANMRIKMSNTAIYYSEKCSEINRTADSYGLWTWGLNGYDARFNWENANVTPNMDLAEKYLYEAKTLFEEAEDILPK